MTSSLTSLLVALPVGYLADILGRKRSLMILGFSPWFWLSAGAYYVRLTLMNLRNPVYQTFVIENADPEARATVASLTSIAWSFGWAFNPTISGEFQIANGFGPPFLGIIILYSFANFLYWIFFWGRKPKGEIASVTK